MRKLILLFLFITSTCLAGMDNFAVKIMDLTNPSGSQDSSIIDLSQYAGYTLQITPTSTLAFTGNIYVSNDLVQPANFTLLSYTNQSIGSATSFVYNVSNAQYKWMKFNISSITGSGRVTVQLQAKAF
jgi:hypothetical protein